MPRRDDISTIMVLGSGPIVIGQAAEFDYSGTQACAALRAEGYRVVLVNSNPATIMTDPEVADRTYVEPLAADVVEAIIARERPDALLPTLGGQTALNLATELHRSGALERHGVELIGADAETIHRAEDRDAFRVAMAGAGLAVAESRIATTVDEALAAAAEIGFPVILRPAFTLGGEGGGVAATAEELAGAARRAIEASPIDQVLVERSLLGWGEFEMEVVRDRADNAVIVCCIENVDPMGVHTGDSVTVAPAMTLTDAELQQMRDASIAVVRAVGVETGGANVQFALNRATGELVVIEMNPRVSRSSALASKATGFPIAKIAARLAVGYTLDELPNDITAVTPASFEPSLDYVAVKAPRFAFEKMQGPAPALTTRMQSVGESLALGRTFAEAFAQALAGRELDVRPPTPSGVPDALERLRAPSWDRFDVMMWAFAQGASVRDVSDATGVHPWFCEEIAAVARRRAAATAPVADLDAGALLDAHRAGLTDRDIARGAGADERAVARRRHEVGALPGFRAVDTCAGEFAARTPYYYPVFGSETEVPGDDGRPAVVVLGSGPNRIGQGVEFDYCCVHAVRTARDLGYRAVMVNCNPETVSTDHGVSDRLYIAPLTLEAVLDICREERPHAVIATLGGQTPLRLAAALAAEGVPLAGTAPEAIDLAEDRGRFGALLAELGLLAPPWAAASSAQEALAAGERIGYPLLARPSYVLGGRAMVVCDGPEELAAYVARDDVAWPVLLDRYLEGAVELDVDALADGTDCWIAGVMEHVEEAGVHSGDSACVLPPQGVPPGIVMDIEEQTVAIARALGVVGLLNVQFAILDDRVYVLEANPRASRTVPFVAKATGVPVVRHATRVMLGTPIAELDLPRNRRFRHVAVKEAVLPFSRFPATDPVLGPEMRATGEVMGVADSFPVAFAKAQRGAGQALPAEGAVFVSTRDSDKPRAVALADQLLRAGLTLVATGGTAAAIAAAGLPVETVNKVSQGSPHIVDLIGDGRIAMVVNTPSGRGARSDGAEIRRAAVRAGIPCVTTIAAAEAAARAMRAEARGRAGAQPVGGPVALQDLEGA
ncbi:MAG: carbamoyl-phosphate synthase large subunit, partial [Actinomycetota bacterium]